MTYVEVNNHTCEKRQHSEQSVLARMTALGLKALPPTANKPVETQHETFRLFGLLDAGVALRTVNSDGSWGFRTCKVDCDLCHGTGMLDDKDADIKMQCWECHGSGKVLKEVA